PPPRRAWRPRSWGTSRLPPKVGRRGARNRVEGHVPFQLFDTTLHYGNVLGHFCEEYRALERSQQELRDGRGVTPRVNAAEFLSPAEHFGQSRSPLREDPSQPEPEPLVDVRQLGGEVPDRTAPHAISLPLVV